MNPQELDLDRDIFSAPVQVHVRLDRHDPYLQCQFELRTGIRLECDRCLSTFEYRLEARAPMLYVRGRPPSPETLDDPEISYVSATTMELDVTTDVRDFLILAMPERHLCSEDCKGLCAVCGADLNIVPCTHVQA